jgi:hypothetical protein
LGRFDIKVCPRDGQCHVSVRVEEAATVMAELMGRGTPSETGRRCTILTHASEREWQYAKGEKDAP